jgi:YggT family protein
MESTPESITESTDVLSTIEWGTLLNWVLAPFFGVMILLFVLRIVLAWYPQVDDHRFPLNLICWPTEPFLVITRKLIPPLGGVDISPIIWVGILSLLRELFLGQQGLFNLLL